MPWVTPWIGVVISPYAENAANFAHKVLDDKNEVKGIASEMKDRFSNEIGVTERQEDWNSIDWKTIRKRVRNLRQRIYRATQCGQYNKVRSLMKLMLCSFSNLLMSVRRVTQENQGKKTAGVDGHKVLTPEGRVKLVRDMLEYNLWQVSPTKRVYIPKANGKRRPLGIATVCPYCTSILESLGIFCWTPLLVYGKALVGKSTLASKRKK